MKIAAKLLIVIYLIVIVFSLLEILRGDIMSGVVGFIIAIGIYKFSKYLSWEPQYLKGINKDHERE